MDKLTKEELQTLIELVEHEREGMRQASYSDENIHEQYLKLGLISMKLDIMQKKLEIADSPRLNTDGF